MPKASLTIDGTEIISKENGNLYLNDNIETTKLYDFSGTINFTSCGRNVGCYGPNLTEAIASYTSEAYQSTWLNNINYFNVVAGVQFFRVPKTGTYSFTLAGARGGDATYAGLGISLSSSADLISGEWLKIVCGQKGNYYDARHAGGGGASFIAVFRMGIWLPLLVAGGGAGQSNNSPNSSNSNRNAFAPGAGKGDRISDGGDGSWYSSSYTSSIGYYWPGGGGGGWSSDGEDGTINYLNSNQPLGGRALNSTSPIGGNWRVEDGATTASIVNNGGFGGGGATGRSGGAAGGGGGWWGGNSSYARISSTSDDTTLLGGGSYSMNSYTNNGTNNGPGFVSLTL